ncbi:MAG: hypothetical protein H6721_19020 [Sandaracinus sp.]|nr:hypothetical protein [Sandaracinus sp.]MCB9634220.1 hypothetical protein [Sandaracinus sp.]
MMLRFPIHNKDPQVLQVGIEPEGDVFALEEGQSVEIRIEVGEGYDDFVEIESEGRLLFFYYMAEKEVWRDGKRLR